MNHHHFSFPNKLLIDSHGEFGVMERVLSIRSDWAESLLIVSLTTYLLAVVVFDINVPGNAILRPVIGFILLIILPGYLLSTLLGLTNRPPGRTILYSVGLSLPVIVWLSIAINTILPIFGVSRPLSPSNLTVAVSGLVLGLNVVCTTDFGLSSLPSSKQDWFGYDERSTRSLLNRDRMAFVVASLLPLCLALVTVFTSTTGFDWLKIMLLCAVSVVPIIFVWWQGSPALYPYAIWAVTASVLLQMTLVSGHLWGWDIHYEYFTASEIYENGYWNAGRANSSISLVTVTLLAAVYSMVSGMEIVWVYKLIYPLLVSLLPVGIWYIARSVFSDRSVAMLAPFTLVFFYGFFKDMPDKQLVAGLFAVLILVTFLDKHLSTFQRWILGLSFGSALVFSHYGVSLLLVVFLGFSLVARYVVRIAFGIEIETRITHPGLIAFLFAFWVVWYLFTASGVNFYSVAGIVLQTLEALPFPKTGRSGVAYATKDFKSVYWLMYKFLHVILVGLISISIVVGSLYTLFIDYENTRLAEYTLFSVGVFCFLASSAVVPFGMGFDRTLPIALFFISPFAIVGAKATIAVASHLAARLPLKGLRTRIDAIPADKCFAVLLAILFLFSSGTVFALGGQPLPPYNINLNEDAGWPVYTQDEVEATRWLESHIGNNATVAVYNHWEQIKSRDGLLVSEVIPTDRIIPIWLDRATLEKSAYVYVSHKPMKYLTNDSYIDVHETLFYKQTLSKAPVVYRNNKATIYYVPKNLTSD